MTLRIADRRRALCSTGGGGRVDVAVAEVVRDARCFRKTRGQVIRLGDYKNFSGGRR